MLLNNFDRYKSIFEHYGFESNQDEDFTQRNENKNKKKKKINAKTTKNVSRDSTSKTKKSPKVTTLTVPDRAKKRQAKSPAKSNLSTASNKSSKVPSPIPAIAVHNPSSSTVIASDDIRSSTDLVNSSTLWPNQRTPPESTIIVNKLSDDLKSLWDLDELNRFTRDMFKYSGKSIHNETKQRSHRPRLNCAKDQDQNLEKYIQSRTHCIDVFDEYVSTLKQQHGFIRSAATDQPVFDPAISITGPDIKKDPTAVDREDSRVMKKLTKMEPRKKYALIHEQVGIFIIGGYNLFTKIPIQREPETDYLFKFSGGVTKIPPLQPCRANFAIYTDGNDIYVAGGQTIDNELLDDVQRLNIKKLKWEHITTLTGPIAACGMTVDENRIYLAGGYDILVGETNFLSDYTIYDMSIKKLESASDLPTPRCRSLVFVCDKAVFCISGLIEGRNENHNKKLKISTDILKWTRKMPLWIKVSQTPELTKFHALSFNQPYLEITKRFLNEEGAETKTIMEAHYDFRTNTWANGRAPSDSKPSSPRAKKSPNSKSKSPSKPSKKKKSKKKSK